MYDAGAIRVAADDHTARINAMDVGARKRCTGPCGTGPRKIDLGEIALAEQIAVPHIRDDRATHDFPAVVDVLAIRIRSAGEVNRGDASPAVPQLFSQRQFS